jgi:ATP-dependent Clp protease adaptor protein ClpS
VGSATITPPRVRPRTRRPGGGTGAAWRIIVLNDDHNTFDGVAFALAAVLPGIDFDRGMQFANKIHNSGQAIVWSGEREPAELYWQQLRDHGLTMAPLER